ncbi:MAG: ankyrin repeat domain-containing protein [Alphaproteobacteria bacterium]|nr:ankyrin repeat domain-containing protein [Alphaproteobacteria bacterium]
MLAMEDLEEADKEIESVLKKHPDYSRASALKQRIESANISAQVTADKIFPDQDWTFLHRAAYQAQGDFVRGLIKNGGEVNANDKNGNLPLHIASVRGHTEIVKLLLDAGAAVNVSNKQGRIPLDMAANADIVEILRQTEAKTNKDGTTKQGKKR